MLHEETVTFTYKWKVFKIRWQQFIFFKVKYPQSFATARLISPEIIRLNFMPQVFWLQVRVWYSFSLAAYCSMDWDMVVKD